MKNALKIVEFMKTVEQLCLVERDNLMSSGRQETDADHIFKLAFLVLMIHPYLKRPADCAKMLELALVHDLVEARTGDYSLSAQTARPELKARKKAAEKEAILYYRSVLPPPLNERVYGLFMEYEARETREAKLVWILDKLEANLAKLESMTAMLDKGMSLEDIIRAVLDGFEVDFLQTSEIGYRCACSREKVERALISMGKTELCKMAEEQENSEVTCQFCDKIYRFSRAELQELLTHATK